MWPKVPFTGNGAYVANVASTKLVVLDFWRLKLEIEHWSLSERSCCRSLFERSSGAALPFPLVHGLTNRLGWPPSTLRRQGRDFVLLSARTEVVPVAAAECREIGLRLAEP